MPRTMVQKSLQESTTALIRASAGDGASQEAFFAMLYAELRAIARACLNGERRGHTLQPTALVHEAWVRLVDSTAVAAIAADGSATPADRAPRARFLALAACAMRQVLVDHARRHTADKRGNGWQRVTLSGEVSAPEIDAASLLDLDQGLDELAEKQPRLARVSELRLFAGLELAEIAAMLGISLTTVKLDWSLARAMLTRRLARG